MPFRPPKAYHVLAFQPPLSRDPRTRTVPITGYRQGRLYACGYAAALMVARHFLGHVDQELLFRRLRTGRDGTRQSSIVKELRRQGLRVSLRYDFGFEALRRAIDAGKLVIAYMFKEEHWIVLYGYARDPERVLFVDPRPGVDVFQQTWNHFGSQLGGFGMVVSGPAKAKAADAPDQAEPSSAAAPSRDLRLLG